MLRKKPRGLRRRLPPSARWLLRSRLPRLAFLAALGPGLISGFADNDAGGITTYSIVGAQFGYDLMWVVLASMIALAITQEVGARLGLATGQGFGGLIRQQYGISRAVFAIGVMLLANLGDTVAEFAGIGAALAIFGVPIALSSALAALATSSASTTSLDTTRATERSGSWPASCFAPSDDPTWSRAWVVTSSLS
jgi:Mn2+/Fe2+ NRAMP family transporter